MNNMKLTKFWNKITEVKILVFGCIFAGLYLLYISSLNIYFDTPMTSVEVRMTQGIVGFSFLMMAMILLLFNKKINKIERRKSRTS